jgi:hypothetical protein
VRMKTRMDTVNTSKKSDIRSDAHFDIGKSTKLRT